MPWEVPYEQCKQRLIKNPSPSESNEGDSFKSLENEETAAANITPPLDNDCSAKIIEWLSKIKENDKLHDPLCDGGCGESCT